MTADEHLAWAKKRALEYLDAGDIANAVTSMVSDLDKHPETRCHPAMAVLGMFHVRDNDYREARRWIEGFR